MKQDLVTDSKVERGQFRPSHLPQNLKIGRITTYPVRVRAYVRVCACRAGNL